MSRGKDKGCRHCDDGALRPLFVVLRSFLPELEEDRLIICDNHVNY